MPWTADPSGRVQFGPSSAARAAQAPAVDATRLSAMLRPHIDGNGHQPFQAIEALPDPAGTLHDVLLIGFPFSGLVGAAQPCLAGVVIDVTQYRQLMDELSRQAFMDELTGLYNLRGFLLFGEHELKVARRRRTASAIVYVDIDGMKQVNDTCGHDEGNALLVATATLLRHVFRDCDVISRLGGDEFAVFAGDVKDDSGKFLKDRLREQLLEAGLASASGGRLGVSIGVAACTPGAGVRIGELLTAADRDMYRDKAGKGRAALR